jgi:hypothetical protein
MQTCAASYVITYCTIPKLRMFVLNKNKCRRSQCFSTLDTAKASRKQICGHELLFSRHSKFCIVSFDLQDLESQVFGMSDT